MLTSEEQEECMALLPPLDLVYDNTDTDNNHLTPKPSLVAGFFEKNGSLQDDIQSFQVVQVSVLLLMPSRVI
jgi:hypothetical protein